MQPRDDDPQAKAEAGVAVAADRRRSGRHQAVNPQLLPLLRGEFDPEPPPDREVGGRGRVLLKRELVSGAVIAAALLLVGVALRFVV